VTAGNGCTDQASITITENKNVTASIDQPSSTVLTCVSPSINLTATGGASYSWSDGNSVIATSATLTVNTAGTYTVTVTADNGCTNQASITITENKNVTASIDQPLTTVLTCASPSIDLTATGGASYSWSNGNSVIATSATLTVNADGTYTVTVTADNGCTDQASITITENKNVTASIDQPSSTVLTCVSPSINLTATGGASYSWSNGNSVIATSATLTVNTAGTYTVTVTSGNGCTDQASITITENKNVTASIDQPSSTVLTCVSPSIDLTATGGASYSWSDGNSVIATSTTLTVNTAGTYTVTVTADNGCTDQASIIVSSTPSPTITATSGNNGAISPAGTISVGCGNNRVYVITPGACYRISDVFVDGVSVGPVPGYTFMNVRTDHTITASFTNAGTTLNIVCPPDKRVNASPLLCTATVNPGTPATSAGCTPIKSVTNDHSSNVYPVGTTIVTWTVTDMNNNTAHCQQKITVTDNQNPVISCPQDKLVNVKPGQCFATGINLASPIVWDNCGVASIKNNAPAQFSTGTTMVTWTATDINGNKSSCTQKITVRDNTAPNILSCAPAQKTNAGINCKSAVPNFIPNVAATDDCTPSNLLLITQLPVAGTLVGPGITAVQITVKDAAGNSKTCATSFTVSDITPPTIICPANITTTISGNKCNTSISVPNPAATDNCGITKLTWAMNGATNGNSSSSGVNYIGSRTFNVGITTVTYTVKDASGNTANCSFTVTVNNSKCLNTQTITHENSNVTLKTNDQSQQELSMHIVPVPSEDFFTLKLHSLSQEPVEINIYDMTGRKIQQLGGPVLESYRFGHAYATGFYFVEVLQGSRRATQKIIKQ
ncbi:MAG: HYR domain-containing protein, partial [Chitinophagales bacterium]